MIPRYNNFIPVFKPLKPALYLFYGARLCEIANVNEEIGVGYCACPRRIGNGDYFLWRRFGRLLALRLIEVEGSC